MKDERWYLRRPYSFRGRMTVMLMTASLLACFASLVLAFFFSQADVRAEKITSEQGLAQVILRLDAEGSLSAEEIVGVVQIPGYTVTRIPDEALSMLTAEEVGLLRSQPISTFSAAEGKPVTYVNLAEAMVMISTEASYSVFPVAFWRILSGSLSFLAVFLLITTLVTLRVSQPISQLTAATRKVAGGDFSVKLPEDVPGEVGELMQSFNRMTEALDRNAWLQKDFISSVSHEFKTPIATIRGYTKMLRMEQLDEEQRREFLSAVAAESERLTRLSETLLRLSALEKQAASAETSEVQLDEQLRQIILRMEPVWSEKNIEWDLRIDPVVIRTDGELLGQVWSNLLDNAIKFSHPGGVVTVSLTQIGSQARVTVTDHGIGMDAQTLSRIFDAFYQADSSRSQGGVGLGLSLVRRILDLLGGHIEVRSEPGKGAEFEVIL